MEYLRVSLKVTQIKPKSLDTPTNYYTVTLTTGNNINVSIPVPTGIKF